MERNCTNIRMSLKIVQSRKDKIESSGIRIVAKQHAGRKIQPCQISTELLMKFACSGGSGGHQYPNPIHWTRTWRTQYHNTVWHTTDNLPWIYKSSPFSGYPDDKQWHHLDGHNLQDLRQWPMAETNRLSIIPIAFKRFAMRRLSSTACSVPHSVPRQ